MPGYIKPPSNQYIYSSSTVDGARIMTAASEYGFRNKIINGDFSVWQRGTSFSGGIGYKADRMFSDVGVSNAISRSTDVPSGQGFTYSYKFINTEVNCPIRHAIELPATGSLGAYQVGTTWTFSMWAKTSSPRTIRLYAAFTIGNFGTPEATPVDAVSIGTTSSTWQKFTYTFTIPAGTSLTSATCFQITPFITGNGTGVDAFFAGMQLESGSVATAFEQRPQQVELAMCQRYYWRVQNLGVYTHMGFGAATNTASAGIFIKTPVTMRTSPSSLEFSTLAIQEVFQNLYAVTAMNIDQVGNDVIGVVATVSGTPLTQFRPMRLISNGSTAGYIAFSAEL